MRPKRRAAMIMSGSEQERIYRDDMVASGSEQERIDPDDMVSSGHKRRRLSPDINSMSDKLESLSIKESNTNSNLAQYFGLITLTNENILVNNKNKSDAKFKPQLSPISKILSNAVSIIRPERIEEKINNKSSSRDK